MPCQEGAGGGEDACGGGGVGAAASHAWQVGEKAAAGGAGMWRFERSDGGV